MKILLAFIAAAFLFSGCLKTTDSKGCPYSNTSITVPSSELHALETYIDTNHITATKDPRGFYYKIISAGMGNDTMTLCSTVQISYKGQLANDTTFAQQTNVALALINMLEGWKRALPMLHKGGHMMLYLPPSLGYGGQDVKDQSGKVVIPKYSILKFEVLLTDYTSGI